MQNNISAIWQINDRKGNKIGLLNTPSYLDILDVTLRAKNTFGENSDWSSPILLGYV